MYLKQKLYSRKRYNVIREPLRSMIIPPKESNIHLSCIFF